MHPKHRDYTYYSLVHCTYSRIDFFLIQHKDFLVTSSQIDSISFSDRAPTLLTLLWEDTSCSPRLGDSMSHCYKSGGAL